MSVVVLVCRWCGDAIEPVRGEPGVFTHAKDGYTPCWEYTASAVNAEPIFSSPDSGSDQ